jgi:hypothetical protein
MLVIPLPAVLLLSSWTHWKGSILKLRAWQLSQPALP